MAAEGGTEYGHMITYARSESIWGPFENYPANPVLTNRNKAPFIIQGIGHGDLVQNSDGNWYIVTLGFRQIGVWQPYHHLGHEVFLTPVTFREDGWFTAGNDGTTDESYEIPGSFSQNEKKRYTFDNTDWNLDWCYLRHPHTENYRFTADGLILKGTSTTLNEAKSPTFIGLRQRDFIMNLSVEVDLKEGEAGITLYMDENEHYELALCRTEKGLEAMLRLNIGGIHHVETMLPVYGENLPFLWKPTPWNTVSM